MLRPYVVAFNRDRDFYQVPLALEERNLLGGLVTDFYIPDLGPLRRLPALHRASRRRVRGLPFGKVSWNWAALRMQLLDLPRAHGCAERIAVLKRLDQRLSRAALRLALRREADLFLYSGYAREAFEHPSAGDLRKGLFVFHPHGGPSLEILKADLERHPEVAESHGWHRTEIELSDSDRLDAETRAADFIACASSFTASSLAGVRSSQQNVTIAPYGCFPPAAAAGAPRPDGPARFLFVGQGVQRKGLHHLLKTWRRLRLPGATLTVVASAIDPGIRTLADQPNVTVLGPRTPEELARLYAQSDIFAMPSLVEGFGLVYLEALSAGCFVIGSSNTGLPDLGLPDEAGRVLPAGDLEALGSALEEAAALAGARLLDRGAIQNFSRRLSWERFRRSIGEICRDPRRVSPYTPLSRA